MTYHQKRAIISFASIVVIAIMLVPLNILSSKYFTRYDATIEKRYTLSSGSHSILKSLKKPVTIRFYFSRNTRYRVEYPDLRDYATRVEDLLNEYKTAANGMIKIEIHKDFDAYSNSEEKAQLDNLRGTLISTRELSWFGLSASLLHKKESIPYLDPESESSLEYEISKMIYRLVREKAPKIGIMSSMAIAGSDNPLDFKQAKWHFAKVLEKDYQVTRIRADTIEIKNDIDALIIFHPKRLRPYTLYAIEQYVLRGGKLICFLDNYYALGRARDKGASSLEPLLAKWSVKYETNKVLADLKNPSTTKYGKDPFILSLSGLSDGESNDSLFNANEESSKWIKKIRLLYPSSFSSLGSKTIEYIPLIQSSDQSVLVDMKEVLVLHGKAMKELVSRDAKSYELAVMLKGRFKTAFTAGAPPIIVDEQNILKDKEERKLPHVNVSAVENKVILVADCDMLDDQLWLNHVRHTYTKQVNTKILNDNNNFLLNILADFTGTKDLAATRSRSISTPEFTVVADIELEILKKYESKLKDLENKRKLLEKEITDKYRDDDWLLKKETDEKIKELLAGRKEILKESKTMTVKMRQEIDALGTKLMWVNIAAMPIFFLILAFVVFMLRRVKR
ncbi:MAG: GldG family protein [Lentisphaeria bacterium]|nr:GldG family protein [Lentisphaeria bacterium]NQZ69241.1 GldG family protein [Lentisphaeria bacterium]